MILDGTALARARAPALAERAERVAGVLGRRPRLLLVAFADASGKAPFVGRKLRACAAAGVDVRPLILPPGTTTPMAEAALGALLAAQPVDAVFLEFPFPSGVEGTALTALVPECADVDIMTPGRIARYFADPTSPPPLTVSAGLELLDAYRVDIRGRTGVVVGEDDSFTQMFREALARGGARMRPLLSPRAPDLQRLIQGAELIVPAASVPGLLRSTGLAPGAVVIDVGYFNSGGRGDVNTADGIAHLAAIAPVPDGIGPMTVSLLVERVIAFAEQAMGLSGLD